MDAQPYLPDYQSTDLKFTDLLKDFVNRYNRSVQQGWFPGWSPAEMYAEEDKIRVPGIPGDGVYRWTKEDLDKYLYDVQVEHWHAPQAPYARKAYDIFHHLMQGLPANMNRKKAILACHLALTSMALTYEVADSAPFLVALGDAVGMPDLSLQAIQDPQATFMIQGDQIHLYQAFIFELLNKAHSESRQLAQLGYKNHIEINNATNKMNTLWVVY